VARGAPLVRPPAAPLAEGVGGQRDRRSCRRGNATAEALGTPDLGAFDDLAAGLAALVAVVVVAVVLIPLLLFGIELVILGVAVAASILGRALPGRPWVVQAVPLGDQSPVLTWRVRGWRRSGRVIHEVARALQAGLDPAPGETAEPRVIVLPR
jgi:hypothetical protein